jgi:hypothetical protein
MGSQQDIRDAWRTFLIELELARNYPIGYQINHGTAVRNPVLEKILPSLLYIRMAAILDEALGVHLDLTSTALPKDYRSTLDGRISFCNDAGRIPNGAELHAIREKRNHLAHDASSAICWPDLDRDLAAVHITLRHLGLVGERPRFEIKAERSAARESGERGVLCYFDYSVSLVESGKAAAEFRWRETVHTDAAN